MAYYFLVASLPTLELDGPAPVGGDEFLRACEDNVAPADYEDLGHIVHGEPEKAKHPLVGEWLNREVLLRNAVARARAARLGLQPEPFVKECEYCEPYTESAVADIMRDDAGAWPGGGGPLKRELALDRLRWKAIDDLAGFDHFGAPSLMAFALKLNLASRWDKMKEDAGRAVLTRFIDDSLAPHPSEDT